MDTELDHSEFLYAMQTRGWLKFNRVVPESLCSQLRVDIAGHVDRCGQLQVKAGIPGAPDGTAHHTVGYRDSLDKFLEQRFLDAEIRTLLSGPYIVHAYNPVATPPGKKNYVHRIHKDVRTYAGSFRMLVNMLVMVDEFTIDNGATHILSGSHHHPTLPTESFFYANAERITGDVGSIVLFDSNVWHAAGANLSSKPRTALTLSLSRPFIKPQMDYARFLGESRASEFSEHVQQLLGFNSRVATDLEEWYRPVDSRMYRSDQG